MNSIQISKMGQHHDTSDNIAISVNAHDPKNKTKGTLVHERGRRLLDGVEVTT